MPELPEVETIRRGMEQVLKGRTITAVDQRRAGLRVPFPAGLARALTDRRVVTLGRRAKYILMRLGDGNVMVIHLGMSGRILLVPPAGGHVAGKHDHLILTFDDGSQMVFSDPRRFGMVIFAPENALADLPAFKNLGPEPLDNEFSAPVLREKLRAKKTSIKAALMDQRVVAGLGNIYVCEALFYSCIHPERIAATLSEAETEKLVQAIRSVLNDAIAAGGSTLRDYRSAGGELGYFQHHFAVYDREGQACPGCHCDISKSGGIRKITQGGRSTYFCPEKQV